MLFFSHWLDLIGKVVSLSVLFSLLIATGGIELIERAVAVTPNPDFFVVMVLLIVFLGFYLAVHRPIVDVGVTHLYVRLRFGVQPSWDQARLLRKLFCLNMRTLEWIPMNHVRSLPLNERLAVLLEAAHE